MAGTSDKVLLRAFHWFQAAVADLVASTPTIPGPLNLPEALGGALRTELGLQLDKTDATLQPSTLVASNARAQSLAVAAMVTGEALAALKTLGEVLADVQNGSPGLDDLSKVIRQIERIVSADPGKPPSAYSIAKLLLILSGDADADENGTDPPARRVAYLLNGRDPQAGGLDDTRVALAQTLMGLAVITAGTILDRAFGGSGAAGPMALGPGDVVKLPDDNVSKTFTLAGGDPGALALTLGYDAADAPGDPATLYARLKGQLGATEAVGDGFQLSLASAGEFTVAFELASLDDALDALPRPRFNGALDLSLAFRRENSGKPLILGKAEGTHFSIGKLSGGIRLHNTEPKLEFDLEDSKLILKIGDDPFLGAVIGDAIEIALGFGLIADTAGGLRLKDGTGLRATIPLEKIPNSPVQIPFLTFELVKADGLNKFEIELSGSFQVQIGPFAGSIDRLGTRLNLKNMLTGAAEAAWGLKPPSGAGMALDAGIVKGGGFLLFDEARGEYGGILDLQIGVIGVKAIGLLSTKNPGGWSLLLVIAAQLPPIQLGFGFTLTGIGGLLGVQHTVSIDALRTGLSTGSLDSFLFPQNPIANAPQIINQLRTIFPFKAGGFVIGPMLELGWGTPSLVTARVGVLIEASQIVFVGQVIVQLPPLVDKALALLRLQVDFAGGVVFDPLQLWFDGVLRDSRVLFISLTGQFAFRAIFGDRPSFLISAGGFHPRFTDLPPGLPSPFQRVGADFSIGVVGVQYRGYFAVTSATVQGGASMRVWGDVGIASFEGGYEFNAIIYLVPKFRFECDIHVFAGIEVFGIDFASVDIYGLFAGPGRWHIVGRAEVHTPWPLPDFSFHLDESWGEDRETTVRTFALAAELKKELEAVGNWSAQLVQAGEAGATFAKLPPGEGLLGHPNAQLQFVQKRIPLAKTLAKLGSDAIEGDKQIAIDAVQFGPFDRAPDRRLDESFPAAQFFEMSGDDLLGKPSFDRFEAGFEIGQRDYAFGPGVADAFDYEEVNLSWKEPNSRLAEAGLLAAGHLAWALDNSAAGRSPLRRAERLQPLVEARLSVDPAPLQLLDASAGTMAATPLAGAAGRSYWHAQDAALARGGAALVVEAFETAGVF